MQDQSRSMDRMAEPAVLPRIPVIDCGDRYAIELLDKAAEHAHALLDLASGHMPRSALKTADAVSRRWLKRWGSPYLDELDCIAALLGRPGAYFFNVHYEWGCTSAAKPCPERKSARLLRVLDWQTRGLGRHIVAARIKGEAGDWLSLTWPGYTGALQGTAPGRFSAALNQAPMRSPLGAFYLDWAANRVRVWQMPHLTPAHLLRGVFETAPDFAAAKSMLTDTPVCAPAIFTLAGLKADETCVIERREQEANVIEAGAGSGPCAANHWQGAAGYRGWARGADNEARVRMMADIEADLDESFAWLAPPVLNPTTRLAMVSDASQGRLIAQGFEADGPATAALSLTL